MLLCRFFIFSCLIFLNYSSFAQSFEIGVGGGISAYSGDLLPQNSKFTKTMGGAGQVYGLLSFSQNFGVEFAYRHGRVHAEDIDFDRSDRNLSFATNIDEISVKGIYNILPFDPYGDRGNLFTVFVGAGVSVFKFNPFTTSHQGQKVFLQEVGTAGQRLDIDGQNNKPYSLVQLGIPLTLGVKYAISPSFTIGLELDYRYIFTDYLDDVGADTYVDFDLLALSNDQAALLANRGWELTYDVNSNINPIDAAKIYFENNNLQTTQRSLGSKSDGYGFIMLKLGYIIEDFSFGGGKGKFGCYEF